MKEGEICLSSSSSLAIHHNKCHYFLNFFSRTRKRVAYHCIDRRRKESYIDPNKPPTPLLTFPEKITLELPIMPCSLLNYRSSSRTFIQRTDKQPKVPDQYSSIVSFILSFLIYHKFCIPDLLNIRQECQNLTKVHKRR